jgi:hydroxypyruvate isomerase
MPKLAANLTMLFGEVPFLDRFAAAAGAGFKGVEYLFPYDYEAGELKARLRDHGLTQVLHNLPAGDWTAGERGIACFPDRVDEFKAGVERAIEYATVLECPRVNCLAGIPPPELPLDAALETFISNVSYAAARLKTAGIQLLIEPINTRDIPGFFLTGTRQAAGVIHAARADNAFIQFDIYHMTIMQEDVTATIERYLPRIAHMQLADVPGRHEPGTGDIDYGRLLRFIDRTGYTGWIGCEYKPKTDTAGGLGWAAMHLGR